MSSQPPTNGDAIAKALRDIRTHWANMLPDLPRAGGGLRVTSSPEPPPPAPTHVLSLRRNVCEVLTSWCRLVIEDALDVNGQHMTVHLDGNDAHGMAGWLMTWADWLGEHDTGSDAVDELTNLAKQCETVVKRNRRRRFEVGPCIDHDTTDMGERVPCQGVLVADLADTDDLMPSALRCNANPEHTYSAADWRRLGERIHSHASTRMPA